MNLKKIFTKLIASALLITNFAGTPHIFALKSKEDTVVIESRHKEIYFKHIEHLLEPWPQIIAGFSKPCVPDPFKGYNAIKDTPEFQLFLKRNREFIDCLHKKIFQNGKNHDDTTEKKLKSLLYYHPIFIKARATEKLWHDKGFYRAPCGCDLIYAILRGDVSVDWRPLGLTSTLEKPRVGFWGTLLTCKPDEALECMESAINLKNALSHNKLDEMTVYRGIWLSRLLYCIDKAHIPCIEKSIKEIMSGTSGKKDFSDKSIIYQAKDISSVSTCKNTAERYARRVTREELSDVPVVLEIHIEKNTAFGMILDDTTFVNNGVELALQPGQKIKINSAEKCVIGDTDGILIKCETTL